MIKNRILEMQLREMERINKKEALLNPKTRSRFIKEEKERKRLEELGRKYIQKSRKW